MTIKDVNDYIEILRKKHGFTMHEFSKGLVSERTYRRYIYEETEIPYDIFIGFLEKLEINVYTFLRSVVEQVIKNNYDETLYFHYLVTDQFEEAEEMKSKLKGKTFISPHAKYGIKLFEKRLSVYQNQLKPKVLFNEMVKGLDASSIIKLGFITIDQIKIIEHLIMEYDLVLDSDIYLLIEKVVYKDIVVVKASQYSYFKVVQLQFYLNHIRTTSPVEVIFDQLMKVLKRLILSGGEMMIDDMLVMVYDSVDINLYEPLKIFMKKYYIASGYIRHENEIFNDEEALDFIQTYGIDLLLETHALIDEVMRYEA